MTSAGDILVVEDHRDIAALVCEHLEGVGFEVDYADTGEAALHLVASNRYDALVLDLMLPGIDGIELCGRMRAAGNDIPVLMLTARDTLADKLSGFESGADDYLVKPFDLPELEARLLAIIRRRQGGAAAGRLVVGDLSVDVETHTVTRAGQNLTVTPTGLKLLSELIRHSPRVVERRALERAVWGDAPPDSDALRTHLYQLRKVVDRPFKTALIHTVHSAGFRIADER
jgi:DNA-binding response OmpR family regulator